MEKKYKEEISENRKQYERNLSDKDRLIKEKNEDNSKLKEKIFSLEIENDKLKIVNDENHKKISKISLEASKMAIDNEVYLKKLNKMQN